MPWIQVHVWCHINNDNISDSDRDSDSDDDNSNSDNNDYNTDAFQLMLS